MIWAQCAVIYTHNLIWTPRSPGQEKRARISISGMHTSKYQTWCMLLNIATWPVMAIYFVHRVLLFLAEFEFCLIKRCLRFLPFWRLWCTYVTIMQIHSFLYIYAYAEYGSTEIHTTLRITLYKVRGPLKETLHHWWLALTQLMTVEWTKWAKHCPTKLHTFQWLSVNKRLTGNSRCWEQGTMEPQYAGNSV